MATTANNLSPRFSSANNSNSPKSHRGSTAAASKSVSPAWTQIVRGGAGDSEVIADVCLTTKADVVVVKEPMVSAAAASDCSPSLSSDESAGAEGFDNSNDGNVGKKPIWNKPSNGDVEAGLVMDADSWPALSESAKASSKSSSESLKSHSDGSVSVSQGTEIAAPAHKQPSNNKNHNSSHDHALPTRQKSMKRHGGNALANGGFAQPPTLPGPVGEIASSNNYSKTHKNSNWESGHRVGSGSHSHGGHDNPHQRNSGRRGNVGPYPRGDASFNHSYGGRRDQDHANRELNPQRRDGYMQPPGVPRSFIRPVPPPPPPPSAAPFISSPMRPFVAPMGYHEIPMYYMPAPPPFVTPIPHHALFFPVTDPQLHTRILNQIDYYFSETNLIKDEFLRRHMDEQGWVHIRLIAGFKKIMEMTDNIQLILGAIQTSTVVEVQVDKVRKRDDWWKFLIPSGPQSFGRSGQDMLAGRVRNITLEERTNNYSSTNVQAHVHAEAYLSRSSSGDSNNQFQPSGTAQSAQANVQAGSDCSVAKNTN